MQVAGIVTPDTILRWYRRLIAQTYDGSARRGRGRPMTRRDVAALVVRMAVENPQWGYTRIRGALLINDNYFCRSPRTGLAGSWVMAAACETARFPCGGPGWSRMHRFGDCARIGCPERHWRQRRRRPG